MPCYFVRRRLADRALLSELCDIALGIADVTQDRVRMLPERRRDEPFAPGFAGKPDRVADMVPSARIGHHDAALPEMRIVQDFGQRVHIDI